jgi:hypothetical protein
MGYRGKKNSDKHKYNRQSDAVVIIEACPPVAKFQTRLLSRAFAHTRGWSYVVVSAVPTAPSPYQCLCMV